MTVVDANGNTFDSEYEHLASQFHSEMGGEGIAKVAQHKWEQFKAALDTASSPLPPSENPGAAEAGLHLAGFAGGASFPFAGFRSGLGMFGGRFSKEALATATQMEKAGFGPAGIKEMTGLEKGAEGMWRREFSDAEAVYNPTKFEHIEGITAGGDQLAKLGDVLQHKNLYEAYPKAADITVAKVGKEFFGDSGTAGLYDPIETSIILSNELHPEQARSVLLHEIQHWIQHHEGFAQGGGILDKIPENLRQKYMDAIKKEYPNQRLNPEYAMYRNVAGEQEAFNVMRRMNMTPDEIRASPGVSTETVPRRHQIIGQ